MIRRCRRKVNNGEGKMPSRCCAEETEAGGNCPNKGNQLSRTEYPPIPAAANFLEIGVWGGHGKEST